MIGMFMWPIILTGRGPVQQQPYRDTFEKPLNCLPQPNLHLKFQVERNIGRLRSFYSWHICRGSPKLVLKEVLGGVRAPDEGHVC